MNGDIMVSIKCITYNHKPYIEDTLKGFLMQKTSFNYEILVHDDASNDGTIEILKKYEKMYPEKIKVIYEKENLYSQSKEKLRRVFDNKINGKYIAVCEGDDYWTDNCKLQKQVEYMEKHPKCSFCFHNVYSFNVKTKKKDKFMKITKRYFKFLHNYNVGDLAKLDFIPTASIMYRSENISKIPDFYYTSIVGDLPLRLIMTSFGYCHYINRIMGVYVQGTGKSATDVFNSNKEENIKNAVDYLNKKKEIIKNVDIFTNYKYHRDIEIELNRIESDKYMFQEKYNEIFKNSKIFFASPRRRQIEVIKKMIKKFLRRKDE